MSERVPLTRPTLGPEELAAVSGVLDSRMLVQGARVAELEARLAERLEVPHLVATSTGTSAIHLALVAAGIGPGDEVVVPDFCFPSVASAVIYTGATPVLCDVDPDTFNLDLTRVEAALAPDTKAVLAVHQFGIPCDAPGLADALACPVIEDAACALGGRGSRGALGTQTLMGCFSLHPRKVITTAEGGLVATRDATLAESLRALRNHGMRPGPRGVEFVALGFPYRLSEVHAALGLAQVDRLDFILEGRRRAALAYRALLDGVSAVIPMPALWQEGRVHQGMVVRLDSAVDRDGTAAKLREAGVEATIGTYAIHRQRALARHARVAPGGLAGSVLAADHAITLPLFPEMTDSQVERVVDTLRKVVS